MPAVRKTEDTQKIREYESNFKDLSSAKPLSDTSPNTLKNTNPNRSHPIPETHENAPKSPSKEASTQSNGLPSTLSATKPEPALTKPEKQKLVLQLVADTLETGKINEERTISSNGKVLAGVTVFKTYKYLGKHICRQYRVDSYDSNKTATTVNEARACRLGNPPKWYPAIMLENPSKRNISGDEFTLNMIGSSW